MSVLIVDFEHSDVKSCLISSFSIIEVKAKNCGGSVLFTFIPNTVKLLLLALKPLLRSLDFSLDVRIFFNVRVRDL